MRPYATTHVTCWRVTLFIQQRANSNWPRALYARVHRHTEIFYEISDSHHSSTEAIKGGSDSIRIRSCGCSSESSLAWWLPRPQGWAHNGCVSDFRYGPSVHLPSQQLLFTVVAQFVSKGPCLLLAIHQHMGCHDPSVLPSQLLAPMAGEVSLTHAITLTTMSIIPGKT